MTNPNNAIGTNGAFSGRTSPNALNDITGAFTKGITSGWVCSPKSGMTVQLGGSASVRDVALAEDNAGNKLTINNRSGAPVEVTLDGAPSTNNRIDAIVAYVDNPSTGDDNTTDNPTACGIISVKGTVAANPVAPTDAQIRSAITTDGATGGVAYYVVLATILVGTNVTTIGSGVITQGAASQSLAALADGSITTDKLADGAVTSQKVDWTTLTGASWPVVNAAASNSNINSDAWYNQYVYSVTVTGVYLCLFTQRMTDGANGYDFQLRISHGSDSVDIGAGGSSWVNYIPGTVFAVFKAQAGDSIVCASRGGGSGVNHTQYGKVSIVRLY